MKKKFFLDAIACVFFYWSAKFASIFMGSRSFSWSVICFICLWIVVANCIVLIKLKGIFFSDNKTLFARSWKYVLANFLMALPFAPDIYFLFSDTGSRLWVFAFLALAILVSFLTSFLRFPAVFILKKFENHAFKNLYPLICSLFLLYLFEFFVYLIFPFFSLNNFAFPINLHPFLVERKIPGHDEVVVAIDPQISNNSREALRASGSQGLAKFARALNDSIDLSNYKLVTYVLPETTLFASREDVAQLFFALGQEYFSKDKKFSLLIGVRDGNLNRIYASEFVDGSVAAWPLKSKDMLVPVLEKKWAGIYLGDPGSATILDESPKTSSLQKLHNSLRAVDFAICYEAMNQTNLWGHRPLLVLTNHGSFRRGKLLSLVYDNFLQLMQRLSGRTFLLVGNYGNSGILFNNNQSKLPFDLLVYHIDFDEK